MLARRGWVEAVSGCAARRWVSYVQLPDPASGEGCLVAVAEGIRAVRVVVGSQEGEAGTVRVVVGLVAGIDRAAARAVVDCGAAVGRMHLLKR